MFHLVAMRKSPFIFFFFLLITLQISAQRVVADCTITYGISADDQMIDKDVLETLKSSTKTVYIRGNDCRMDLISPSFTQSLIFDKTTGSAVVLREIGSNKFMTKLDAKAWATENKKYEGMTVSISTSEKKTILGYECKKATMKLLNGDVFTLYFATAIMPSVKEYEYQFKDIQGLVLEYESIESQTRKVRYTATKINLSPVQASRFDIPTTGYRLLN
jgi:hypothetical protein